jgi:hypothetical protein
MNERGGATVKEKPFVTVYSPKVVIRVVGEAPRTDIPQYPEFTAWQSSFALVSTSFGEKTALYDRQTGLVWLRPTLAGAVAEESIREKTKPRQQFAGWRFATPEEVASFLADFTGSPDGTSTEPAIERKLLRLLGGDDTQGIHNDEGWSRIALYVRVAGLVPATTADSPDGKGFVFHYAYIAEDRQHGQVQATVAPYLKGWTRADGDAASDGIFLVRSK